MGKRPLRQIAFDYLWEVINIYVGEHENPNAVGIETRFPELYSAFENLRYDPGMMAHRHVTMIAELVAAVSEVVQSVTQEEVEEEILVSVPEEIRDVVGRAIVDYRERRKRPQPA